MMRSTKFVVATLAVVGTPVSAFWRMECRGVTGQARLDPLVDYGLTPGAHSHEIFGSGGFSSTSDFNDLVSSDCTSCAVTADKSAYWTPHPLFQDEETGQWEAVANVGGMLAYYFLNPAPYPANQTIVAYPEGFRMIAGDTSRRNYTVGGSSYEDPDPDKALWASLGQTSQTDLEQRAVGFNCLDYSKAAEGSLYRHFLPSKDYIDQYCPDGIRFELMFPSCWDGVTLDSDNHRSHVAYPDLVIDGACPEEFPVRLPGLFFETIWDMGAYSDRKGMFAISNGDPLGFGYHGDFIMGWDSTNFTLQQAVNDCTDMSGKVEACEHFTVISEAEQQSCQFDMPNVLKEDDTAGPIDNLPGNVALAWGPGPAAKVETLPPAGAVHTPELATLSYSAAPTNTPNQGIPDHNIVLAAAATTLLTTSAPPVITPAPVAPGPDALDAPDRTYHTYTDESGDVFIQEIVYEEAVAWVTELVTKTVYVDPVARRNAHAHAHRHRHARGRN